VSTNSVTLNTGQQAIIQQDLAKIFVWSNRFQKFPYEYENNTYDDVTVPAGTLMGRISATQKVVPLESAASDGSQYPVGILGADVVILAGDTFDGDITLCVEGDVVESQVLLDGSDTMATVISDRSIYDRIGADTVGIKLVDSIEMTAEDNE